MDNGFYTHLKVWFDDYISGFERLYPQCRAKFDLKREHSHMVARETSVIAEGSGLEPRDRTLAKVIGLLHDIGRFPQAAHFTTFDDRISIDHGALGVSILYDNNVLARLNPSDQIVVETAVLHHNKHQLPKLENDRCYLFSKLIRDADKLDIFRVIRDNYNAAADEEESHLPGGTDISEKVLSDVTNKAIVRHVDIRSRIDRVFFWVAWLFDINFATTLRHIIDRGYYDMLRSMLPETGNIKKALDTVDIYLQKRSLNRPPAC